MYKFIHVYVCLYLFIYTYTYWSAALILSKCGEVVDDSASSISACMDLGCLSCTQRLYAVYAAHWVPFAHVSSCAWWSVPCMWISFAYVVTNHVSFKNFTYILRTRIDRTHGMYCSHKYDALSSYDVIAGIRRTGNHMMHSMYCCSHTGWTVCRFLRMPCAAYVFRVHLLVWEEYHASRRLQRKDCGVWSGISAQ